VILPFVRRHRTRYAQYLPLSVAGADLSLGAENWRTKLSDALYALFMPSTWGLHRRRVVGLGADDDDSDDDDFDADEGEGMVGFEPVDQQRREALEQRRSLATEERRLGRELEQGFKDDSDDEEPVGRSGRA
jgi:hypothetical protein